ncbi:MAG: PQQ-binding-like beta-propeller repeat protein [Verrucomicrobia bacterium]|nr:PQQ-binding-like beta-propeller repeat protein [Verrucomicrobiota bacterium]
MKTTSVLLGLAFAAQLSALGSAPDWPQFRGPNSSGLNAGGHPPSSFGPGSNVLFKVEAPRGLSSPCAAGGRVFLTAADGGRLLTLAFDGATGKQIWKQSIDADKPREMHKRNDPAASTPATDGQSVCVYHATFGLVAYDVSGKELWRKPMPGMLARNGSGTSPAMIEGRLILNCDVEESKSFLAAYDPATGKELWRTSRPTFISGYTTPMLWSHEDRKDIVVSGSLQVTGYDLSDGKERWHVGGTEAVSVCPTPVEGAGQLYIMSRSMGGSKLPPFALFASSIDKDGDGKISRDEIPRPFIEQGMFSGLDRNQDGFITEKEWTDALAMFAKAEFGIFALKTPVDGELGTNSIVWKHKKGVASISTPLFLNGRVYVVQDGGRLTCYDAKTGAKAYEQERLDADGDYYASPIAANGLIYLCSTRGVVSVVRDGEKLEVAAKNDLQEPIFATPAIVGDRLYVRTDSHLWSFGR